MAKTVKRKKPANGSAVDEATKYAAEKRALQMSARAYRNLRKLAQEVLREKRKADAAVATVAAVLAAPVVGGSPLE